MESKSGRMVLLDSRAVVVYSSELSKVATLLSTLQQENSEDISSITRLEITDAQHNSEPYSSESMVKFLTSLRCVVLNLFSLETLVFTHSNLFTLSPHPFDHVTIDSLTQFTDIICKTSIVNVDLSSTVILGSTQRQLKGFRYFCTHYLSKQCQSLVCKDNNLHSLALSCLSQAMATSTSLTHLDLSHNCIGRDNYGNESPSGIIDFCGALRNCLTISELDVSSNHLTDMNVARLLRVVVTMPQMRTINLAHNSAGELSCLEVKSLLAHHSQLESPLGIERIDFSCNPLGGFVTAFCGGLATCESLQSLDLTHCGISESSSPRLIHCALSNTTLQALNINHNDFSESSAQALKAAVNANHHLRSLSRDAHSIRTEFLSDTVCRFYLKKIIMHLTPPLYTGKRKPSS